MKINKLGTLLLAGALTIGLTACSGDDTSKTDDSNNEQQQNNSSVKEFTITGTNFDLTSDKELVVNKGDTVKIHLVNEEGHHGIAVDGYDVETMGEGTLEFVADKTGEFDIICSIMCGTGHADMIITLTVQ